MLINKSKLNKYKSLSVAEKLLLEEKLKNSCSNQSDSELLHCIIAGIIKLEDIQGPLDDEDRYGDLEKEYEEYKKSVLAEEKKRLKEIEDTQHPKDKRQKAEAFLNDYPTGNCVSEVKRILQEIEDAQWARVSAASSSIVQLENELDAYLVEYPEGTYTEEAKKMKNDLPWTKVKLDPTFQGLDEYEGTHPGEHTDEIRQLREDIQDDLDFRNVNNDKVKAQEYLNKHPHGKHVAEALEIINRPDSDKDIFLQNLKLNRNYYSAKRIKRELGNRIITEIDLKDIFTPEQIQAIKSYEEPTPLPPTKLQNKLVEGLTEVYFWGTKGTGKTCALGAILSAAKKKGIFEPIPGSPGGVYMTSLSNLFTGNDICILPDSTAVSNIPAMTLMLKDEEKRFHKMMFVDFAGEILHAMYKQQNGITLMTEEEKSLEQIQAYLKNGYNNKIHFFVVEYGEDKATEEILPGVRQIDMLQAMSVYLREQLIYSTSTVGVYCLVTKCDRIRCKEEDRPEYACKYVIDNYAAFWDNVVDDSNNAEIAECKTISFSIGEVFAQNLCQLPSNKDADSEGESKDIVRDPEKVISKLLAKTHAEPGGIVRTFRK